MSSTNKTANYQLSQFVGTDIPSILNDYNGDMRKIDSAIKETSVAGGDNATAIAELQATTGRLSTEVGGINATVNSVSGRVLGIEDKIPANASADNKLITAQDIPEIPSVEQIEQNVANLQTSVDELQEEVSDMGGDVKAIQLCVPANASESNKFATKSELEDAMEISVYPGSAFSVGTTYKDALESALKRNMNFHNRKEMFTKMQVSMSVLGEGTVDNGDVLCGGVLKFNSNYYENNKGILSGFFIPNKSNAPEQVIRIDCYLENLPLDGSDFSNITIVKMVKHLIEYGGTPSVSYPFDMKNNSMVAGDSYTDRSISIIKG